MNNEKLVAIANVCKCGGIYYGDLIDFESKELLMAAKLDDIFEALDKGRYGYKLAKLKLKWS